jgi:hypothetical protein
MALVARKERAEISKIPARFVREVFRNGAQMHRCAPSFVRGELYGLSPLLRTTVPAWRVLQGSLKRNAPLLVSV